MPPPITAQVATVRQSTSVPAKFQMASRQATTATRMQALVVQKEILVTILGFKKPLFIIVCAWLRCYWAPTGFIARSARTGPSSVTAAIRNGKRRESSPTQMRICILSDCASSVVSDNKIVDIF
jgi:hypothetical protein